MPETLVRELRTPPRLRYLAGALVLLLVGLTWVVDESRIRRETPGVESCARTSLAIWSEAEVRLNAMARYLQPAVSARPGIGIYTMLSDVAERIRPSVERALSRCQGVEVWRNHVSAQRVLDAHVALLTAELARLDRVAADGRAFYEGYADVLALRDAADRSH